MTRTYYYRHGKKYSGANHVTNGAQFIDHNETYISYHVDPYHDR
jgi:hypothetical protein